MKPYQPVAATSILHKTSFPTSALSRFSCHVGQMSTIQLRNRKVKNDGIDNSSLANETDTQKHEVKTAEITRTDSLEQEVSAEKSLLSQFKAFFYHSVFFPFWKHLDDRGFGTPQPFICWLLIPFTLSMIVWYFSVIELMDLADWESKMGPIPTYPEPEKDFAWGEL